MVDDSKFAKENSEGMLSRIRYVEEYTDDKYMAFNLARLNCNDKVIIELWQQYASATIRGEILTLEETEQQYTEYINGKTLDKLEIAYKIYDFVHTYNTVIMPVDDIEVIADRKKEISDAISEKLEAAEYNPKRCMVCSRPIQWSSKYRICQKCYEAKAYKKCKKKLRA
jgi:hypothetical protein